MKITERSKVNFWLGYLLGLGILVFVLYIAITYFKDLKPGVEMFKLIEEIIFKL